MLFRHSFALAAVALTRAALSAAQINVCPGTEVTQMADDGSVYQVCPGTDYQGTSTLVQGNVAASADCTELCSQTAGCTKAVYDHVYKYCHVKGSPLTWVVNQQFDAARFVKKVQQGSQITSCPVPETTQTINNVVYTTCPFSDYQGPSNQVTNNIADNAACTQLCANSANCARAVFDNYNRVCHIKAEAAVLVWTINKQFNTIRTKDTSSPASVGKWSDIVQLPVIPVAAYVVPQYPESSRLLVFSSYKTNDFGGANGLTQFADYNFKTGAVSQRSISNTQHDMFCPGISSLTDGKIIITGGSDAAVTSLYDPSTNAFTRGPDMQIARGYQTSATLSNGKVFTIGGSYSGGIGGKDGEVYDPATNKWTKLSGALVQPMLTTDHEGDWRTDNHGWLVSWRDGSVFQAGPSTNLNWYTTSGSGGVKSAGTRSGNHAMCGVWVMYDALAGKIFSAGGSPDYTDSPATTTAHITTIDQVNQPATVERVADMKYPRGFANAVVLPDGTILITGGQRRSLVFTDTDAILAPELFDPKTKTFRVLSPEAVPRNYHSVSLLLPDGTVFSGGGGLCYAPSGQSDANCNRAVDHPNGQIFSPPYLFRSDGTLATRPVISSLSSSSASNGYTARVGGTLTVQLSSTASGMTFSLVRIGSVTHSVNSDQRRIPLTNFSVSGAKYTITLPSNAGNLLPGNWYLFAISKDGVPSVARTVRVTL